MWLIPLKDNIYNYIKCSEAVAIRVPVQVNSYSKKLKIKVVYDKESFHTIKDYDNSKANVLTILYLSEKY